MSPTLGAWLFATVAMILVGVLAYRLGRHSGRPDQPPGAGAASQGGVPQAATHGPAVSPATEAELASPAAPGPFGSAPTTPSPAVAPAGAGPDPHHTISALLESDGDAAVRVYAPGGAVGAWQWVSGRPPPPGGPQAPFLGLSSTVVEAVARLGPGESAQADGWRISRCGEGAAERLVLRAVTAAPVTSEDSAAFSFTVSHDLRAPVRVVEGFARILKEDYGRQLDRIGNDHLDRVLGAAARMNAMIDAMLSLARLSSQPLARQPVNLSQLATFIVEDLRKMTPTRQVEVDIEPGLQVTGDPTLLRQVLENLLANAWKYSGKREQARIGLRCLAQDGQRVFEVSDNGAGFDMRSADRLFGLFQRLHSANDFPGTGVGLASVQRIVRRHGGRIWADAEPGQGARFCFTLPA